MLLRFRFKNYKSFYDETVLDLEASKELSHFNHLIVKNNNKILSTIAIHGNNASGKTNVLNALFYMRFLVLFSFQLGEWEDAKAPAFKFDTSASSEPSEFEVFIEDEGFEYQYGFNIIENTIINEWLYRKKFSSRDTVNRLIFERKRDKIITEDLKLRELFEIIKNDNVLFINILGKRRVKPASSAYDFFNNIFGISDKTMSSRMKEINTYKLLFEDAEIKEKVESLLQEIDSNISSLKIEQDEKHSALYKMYGLHCSENNEIYSLDIEDESLGTIKFVNVIPHIFKVLLYGGTILIDELDTKFHPLIYRKIVSLFYDKEINTKNAQLIFTTHSTFLLNPDDIRRDQIIMIEKDKNGKSSLYSLADFDKLRIDSNYEKKYLAGELGAIPFINRD